MKRILIVLLIVGLFVGIKLIFFSGNEHVTKSGPQQGPKPRVKGIVAKGISASEIIRTSGSIRADEQVALMPETAGLVTGIFFDEGSKVNKGSLLVKINDADLQAQLKRVNAQLNLAREQAGRQKQLFDIKAISREELSISENQTAVLEADKGVVEAQIAKTEIKAPFSGRIGLRGISPGMMVSSTTIIAQLIKDDVLKVDCTIPERYALDIKTGMFINVQVAGFSEQVKAEIYAIEPGIDENTRSLILRGRFKAQDLAMKSGAFAEIEIPLNPRENSIFIPTEAVIPILKGQKVLLKKGGKVEEVKIVAGIRKEATIEVLEGVSVGDTIITTGILSLRKGMPVEVIVSSDLGNPQDKVSK